MWSPNSHQCGLKAASNPKVVQKSKMVNKCLQKGHQATILEKWSPSSQQMIQKWSPSNHQLTKWSPSSNQMVHKVSQSDHEMVTKWSNFEQFFDALLKILVVNSYIYAYHCKVCRDWQSIEWGTINRMNKYHESGRDLIACRIYKINTWNER